MASKNPNKAFIGTPQPPDVIKMGHQQKILEQTTENIVKRVRNGENEKYLVMEVQEDPAFQSAVGKLANTLGDKVRQRLAEYGII